jgi:hypothetical protein
VVHKAYQKGEEKVTYEHWLIDNPDACFPWGIKGNEVLQLVRTMAAEGNQDFKDILREPVDDATALRITMDFINSTVISCGAVAVAEGRLTMQSTRAEVEAELERIRNLFGRSHQ